MNPQASLLPFEVVIEVTSLCNFNCTGCFNNSSFAESGRGSHHSPEDTLRIKKIIDSIAEAGIKTVRFTGGEPLLRNDLPELFEYARQKKLNIRLNTNASLIDQPMADLIHHYVSDVLISFNGYDDESDEAWTRMKKSFSKKIKGLSFLNPSVLSIRAGTVLTSSNIVHLEKIFKQIQNSPLKQWEVYRPVTQSIVEPLKEEIGIVLDKLVKMSVEFKSVVKIANAIPFCLHDREVMNEICLGAIADDGHSRLIADPRGFLKPSYFINENLGSSDQVLDGWNRPFMKSMRELNFLPDECRACDYLLKCKGGSRFKAHSAFNNYRAPDPLKPLIKNI